MVGNLGGGPGKKGERPESRRGSLWRGFYSRPALDVREWDWREKSVAVWLRGVSWHDPWKSPNKRMESLCKCRQPPTYNGSTRPWCKSDTRSVETIPAFLFLIAICSVVPIRDQDRGSETTRGWRTKHWQPLWPTQPFCFHFYWGVQYIIWIFNTLLSKRLCMTCSGPTVGSCKCSEHVQGRPGWAMMFGSLGALNVFLA